MTRARVLVLSLALVPLAGCAPDDIARASCTDEMLAAGDPWSCTIEAERVGQASSLEFDTESRNHVAKVKLALSVTKGTLRVNYRDLTGDRQLTVTPTSPAALEMETRLHRERRAFWLYFEPVGGDVEGLRGTVRYYTP